MKFSVLMSVYKSDNAKHFLRAVNSVLKQSVKPDEIIIVIDGMVGNELSYAIDKVETIDIISVFHLQENRGLGYALAYGMRKCKYNLVARMDSDDISNPRRFEKQLSCFLKNPQLALVGGYVQEFTTNLHHLNRIKIVPTKDKEIKQSAKFRCPFNHPTVMFQKKAVLEAGGYKTFMYNEDYYLWLRMIEKKQIFMNLDCVLVYMRVDENTYKRRGGISYFLSELRIQQYMLSKKIIDVPIFCFNVCGRLAVQLLCTNRFRKWIYNKFFRVRKGQVYVPD